MPDTVPSRDDGELAELRELTWAVQLGEIDAAGIARLDALVCGHLELRREYIRLVRMLSDTRQSFSVHPAAAVPAARVKRPAVFGVRFGLTPRIVGIAVSLLLVGYFVAIGGLLVWDRTRRADDHERVATQLPVKDSALLTHADDAKWKQEQQAADGQPDTKTLQVSTGLAELKFAQGAKVTLQGPAEFEVRSANQGFLRRGKLVALVPRQAIGFTVVTPTATIVDLGTEFGVEADAHGATNVRVFRGKVELHPDLKHGTLSDTNRSITLTAGAEWRVERKGTNQAVVAREIQPDAKRFSVTLQNATATFSQSAFPVGQLIDGITSGANGWAINPNEGVPQTTVWETDPLTTVGGPEGTALMLTLIQNHGGNHTLGRFRLSVTTASRTVFADGNTGVSTPGDVGAPEIWTPLKPSSVSDANGQTETFTINPDNSISVSGDSPATATYIVTATTTLTGITGIRLEALKSEDNGPGRAATATGGNFVLSEFTVHATNLPATRPEAPKPVLKESDSPTKQQGPDR